MRKRSRLITDSGKRGRLALHSVKATQIQGGGGGGGGAGTGGGEQQRFLVWIFVS